MPETWRVGRIDADGNTCIRRQLGAEPSDEDPIIGRMRDREEAKFAVAAVNTIHRMHAAVGWEVTAADLTGETP